MIKLTINKCPYFIPTNGDEITLKQLHALKVWATDEKAQEYDLVSALSGMDIDDAIESAHIWNGRLDIASMVELFKLADKPHDKAATVNGQELKPKALPLLKVSHRVLLKQLFDNLEDDTLVAHLPRVLAIGFGEQMNGKGWTAELSLTTQIFEEQSAKVFIPIAYFFLRASLLLKRDGSLWSSLLMRHGVAQVGRKCKGLVYGQ